MSDCIGDFYELSPTPKEPADKIAFHVQQYMGSEIYDREGNPITDINSLKVGDEVSTRGLFGRFLATVTKINGDEATAETEHTFVWLQFGRDDRARWVSHCQGNKSAILKAKFV